MRAPAPVALGCISLVLCLLELPACLPLPDGRSPKRREPPDRRPSPASLLGDHPGPQPPALAQPAGSPRHRPLIPRHGPKLAPRHGPRLTPRHGARPVPRHKPLIPRQSPKLAPRHGPRHKPLIPRQSPKLAPRHRPRHKPLIPRQSPKLAPRHGPRHGARPVPRHKPLIPRQSPKLALRHRPRHGARLAPQHVRHLVLRHGSRHARGRRHAPGRLQHAQLLRVGCVLGTCQVQNLSHRLWQLMGQSGRQDSSPMNPNSPHSYG